jgi:hypothetical protein
MYFKGLKSMLFIRVNELTQIIWSNTLEIDKKNIKYYYSSN